MPTQDLQENVQGVNGHSIVVPPGKEKRLKDATCQDDKQPMEIQKPRPSISMFVFIACGIWLIGLGLYFMFLRPPLLPEDLRYMGTSAGEIPSALPGLERWTHRVFTVMGGFMTGAGVLTILVATRANAVREKWTWIALALVGLFTVGTMSLTNFQLNSDFKWLLLIPSLLWLVGLIARADALDSSGANATTRNEGRKDG
jgi:hypothetical protein